MGFIIRRELRNSGISGDQKLSTQGAHHQIFQGWIPKWEDGEPIIEVACSPPVSQTPGALGALGKVPPILMCFVEAVLQCLWSRVQPWLSRG